MKTELRLRVFWLIWLIKFGLKILAKMAKICHYGPTKGHGSYVAWGHGALFNHIGNKAKKPKYYKENRGL